MLIQIIRWFKGYLHIQLIGYSPERFLNICKNKNIIVWNLKSFQNYYEMNIMLKDFKKIKQLCKKTVSKVRILQKIGYPFFIYNLQKRKTFVLGLILSIICIYLTSLQIWSIEVKGSQKLTSDVICSYLKEQSISCGTPKRNINCKLLGSHIRKNFEEIIWVSVSIDGTKLSIELKENTNSDISVNKDEAPTDLIAKYDCIITSIITRNGVPMVHVGDSVSKGDILVSGCVPVLNDNKEIISTNYVKADADIVGEIRLNYQDKLDSLYQKKKFIKESIYWEIGPFKRNIQNKEDKEIFIDHRYIKIGKINLYTLLKTKYTENEREAILKYNYQKYCDGLKEDNTIIKEDYFLIAHYDNQSIAVSNLLLEQPVEESRKIIDLSSENMLQ